MRFPAVVDVDVSVLDSALKKTLKATAGNFLGLASHSGGIKKDALAVFPKLQFYI